MIVLFSLLLGSCSGMYSIKKIKNFEQTLGMDNSKALSEYVHAFENEILKKKYPTLTMDKAYSRLLSEDPYSIAPMNLYDLFKDYNLNSYFKSQLWHEIYAPVDSVWIENSELRIRYVYLSEDGIKEVEETGARFNSKMDKDSTTNREYRVCYFNRRGKYLQAIKSIKNGVPFLEEFYSVKNDFGEISTGLLSDMVNRHEVDLNNYLVRRVIAVELSKYINDAREP